MLIDLQQRVVVVSQQGMNLSVRTGKLCEFLGPSCLAIGDDPDELLGECERRLDVEHRELLDSMVDVHSRNLRRLREQIIALKASGPVPEGPGERGDA